MRQHGAAFERQYPHTPPGVQRVLAQLAACRTKAMGGHVSACSHCGAVRYLYHSCGDRHCPACGGSKRAAWLERRRAELLPVPYFHVVFTLPHQLSALVLGNRRLLYTLLMRAAAQTLLDVAADPKHLGARLGALVVLHTWGQQLEHHPHVHCVVPGGGLSLDGSRWQASRPNFLLPVKVLGAVFRGKYLEGLRQAYDNQALQFDGSTKALAAPAAFAAWLATLYQTSWVVYAKKPFGANPDQVLKYLARYTHRVAISNRRLVRSADGAVTFTYKDYADGCRVKELTLPALEFLRRFALHVVPGGLVRIRQYGLLSNRGRGTRLQHCREMLKAASAARCPGQGPAAEADVAAVAGSGTVGDAPGAATSGSGADARQVGPTCSTFVVLLPLLFAGLPAVPAIAEWTPSLLPRCPACNVGRLHTIWQAPRPRAWDVPDLGAWAGQQPTPREDTS